VDPRTWDLNQMLAAFEVSLQRSAKDESEWRRTHGQIYAEPATVREERRAAARQAARDGAAGRATGGSGMSAGDATALLARFAASDAAFGSG
jgi:hypothetical protein